VVHYQPVVRLRDGVVTGVEALCRWEHPEDGLLPPAAFLPLAESGGLMGLVTEHVLRQAVGQAAAWGAAGRPVDVAVNLSVTNLLDPEFPDRVLDVLRVTGLPGEALHLELTEDLFMADPTRARAVIARLGAAGIRLLVDDYGTGYSSLSYLRELHEVSGLKIDRSFVQDLAEDPRSAAIVESTLQLAASLGLRVVAEGVENGEVAALLRDLGCEYAQGFHFARPAPADAVAFGPHVPEAVTEADRW
jgi:EAL domain-containing protein (putative c-di-GMP-specific phosphodiesterase class I)